MSACGGLKHAEYVFCPCTGKHQRLGPQLGHTAFEMAEPCLKKNTAMCCPKVGLVDPAGIG